MGTCDDEDYAVEWKLSLQRLKQDMQRFMCAQGLVAERVLLGDRDVASVRYKVHHGLFGKHVVLR